MRTLSSIAIALLISSGCFGQVVSRANLPMVGPAASMPSSCKANWDLYIKSDGSLGDRFFICNSTGTGYENIDTTSAGGGVPAGSILLVDSGSCPAGFAEVAALSGKTIIGTISANADVGTTGGSDNITPAGTVSTPTFTGTSNQTTSAVSGGTPAGTNSAPSFTGTQATLTGTVSQPTFTGNALAAHAHELPFQIPSTTTTRQIAVATFGTGTSRAATAVTAAGTANTASAAVALSESKSAGTPTGTVSQPTLTMNAYTPAGTIGAPVFTGSALGTHAHTLTPAGTVSQSTFTGAQFDNRAAFEKLIFCKKS